MFSWLICCCCCEGDSVNCGNLCCEWLRSSMAEIPVFHFTQKPHLAITVKQWRLKSKVLSFGPREKYFRSAYILDKVHVLHWLTYGAAVNLAATEFSHWRIFSLVLRKQFRFWYCCQGFFPFTVHTDGAVQWIGPRLGILPTRRPVLPWSLNNFISMS